VWARRREVYLNHLLSHITKAKPTVNTKKGDTSDVVKVMVFDDTGEATLSLWRSMADSAQSWTAGHTILLITCPGWRIDKKIWLSVTANTMFDVDPLIPDAFWLRGFSQRLTKREHPNPPFPTEGAMFFSWLYPILTNSPSAFDFVEFSKSAKKVLFSFAELDEL
jgi:hypothetical protein